MNLNFRTSGALASRSGAAKEDERKSNEDNNVSNNNNNSIILSDSSELEKNKQKKSKVRRSQSFKLKGEVEPSDDRKSRDIQRKAKGLAKDVKENPSLISKEVSFNHQTRGLILK